jgi:trimethylamine--corrinoid protein Co-methyltransferase
MGPSDSKLPDYQAGLESGLGLVLAALGGISLVAGPGVLDFENCQSFEKLLLDNEAVLIAERLLAGISHGSAGRAVELIGEAAALGSMLGHRHTRASYRAELHLPGPLVDRGTFGEWEGAGRRDAVARAAAEVERILSRGNSAPLPAETAAELDAILLADARRHGVDALPTASCTG